MKCFLCPLRSAANPRSGFQGSKRKDRTCRQLRRSQGRQFSGTAVFAAFGLQFQAQKFVVAGTRRCGRTRVLVHYSAL